MMIQRSPEDLGVCLSVIRRRLSIKSHELFGILHCVECTDRVTTGFDLADLPFGVIWPWVHWSMDPPAAHLPYRDVGPGKCVDVVLKLGARSPNVRTDSWAEDLVIFGSDRGHISLDPRVIIFRVANPMSRPREKSHRLLLRECSNVSDRS